MEPLRELIRGWGVQARNEFRQELYCLTKSERKKCIYLFRQGVPLEEAKRRATQGGDRRKVLLPDGSKAARTLTISQYNKYKRYIINGMSPAAALFKLEHPEYRYVRQGIHNTTESRSFIAKDGKEYKLNVEDSEVFKESVKNVTDNTVYYSESGVPIYHALSRNEYQSFWYYYNEKGLPLQEALDKAKKSAGKGTANNGVKYTLPSGQTLRSYCIDKGLTYSSVRERIAGPLKMSMEESLRIEEERKKQNE